MSIFAFIYVADIPFMMPGYSIEEFRAVPCQHFLFSALCFAGFATGYLHNRETHSGGRFSYWIPGAILGGIVSLSLNMPFIKTPYKYK